MQKEIDNKNLTIKDIREVLIPAMEEVFATRHELNDVKNELKKEMSEKFDKVLTRNDYIIKILETLTLEKKVTDTQTKRERQLLTIIISALQNHKILTPTQLTKIKELDIL